MDVLDRGDKMNTIDLHQAFSWICDECGKRNFERAIAVEMSEEEKESMCSEIGVNPEEGDWLRAPINVQCVSCKAEYEVGMVG